MDRVKWLIEWWWKEWASTPAPPFMIALIGLLAYLSDGYIPTIDRFIENCLLIYILPLAGAAILALYAFCLIASGLIMQIRQAIKFLQILKIM